MGHRNLASYFVTVSSAIRRGHLQANSMIAEPRWQAATIRASDHFPGAHEAASAILENRVPVGHPSSDDAFGRSMTGNLADVLEAVAVKNS